jgi:hypothetical protein
VLCMQGSTANLFAVLMVFVSLITCLVAFALPVHFCALLTISRRCSHSRMAFMLE